MSDLGRETLVCLVRLLWLKIAERPNPYFNQASSCDDKEVHELALRFDRERLRISRELTKMVFDNAPITEEILLDARWLDDGRIRARGGA